VAARTGAEVGFKGLITVVAGTAPFARRHVFHGDWIGPELHLEQLIVTGFALEFHAMHPMREYRRRDVIRARRLALEEGIARLGSGDKRQRQQQHSDSGDEYASLQK